MNIYSKKSKIKKTFTTASGEDLVYTSKKLTAMTLNREGMKLLKAFIPSFGAGMDSFMNRDIDMFEPSHTMAASLQLLAENLSVEHYDDLTLKLMGDLSVDGEKLEDLDEHFDEYAELFFEVLVWLFKENFWTFFTANATAQSLIKSLTGVAKPMINELKERIENEQREQDTDNETES